MAWFLLGSLEFVDVAVIFPKLCLVPLRLGELPLFPFPPPGVPGYTPRYLGSHHSGDRT